MADSNNGNDASAWKQWRDSVRRRRREADQQMAPLFARLWGRWHAEVDEAHAGSSRAPADDIVAFEELLARRTEQSASAAVDWGAEPAAAAGGDVRWPELVTQIDDPLADRPMEVALEAGTTDPDTGRTIFRLALVVGRRFPAPSFEVGLRLTDGRIIVRSPQPAGGLKSGERVVFERVIYPRQVGAAVIVLLDD